MTGPLQCTVEIGGIPIALRADDADFLGALRRRYSGFFSDSPPQAEFDLDISSTVSVCDDDVQVRRVGPEWLVERGDFLARWDPNSGRGRIRQNRNPYAVDSVLRIVHSLILASRGGFLLHAASAIYDGRGYVFSGISGAGKTTMTRLAPPNIVLLTDEVSYIRRHGDGYSAFGTPFAGELARPGENCAAPVAGIFFLERGSKNRFDPVPASHAVRRLMRNILFFAQDRNLVQNIFATACDFVSRVPIYELAFYPDGRVWDEIMNFGAETVHA
jgi:hypothetical protein